MDDIYIYIYTLCHTSLTHSPYMQYQKTGNKTAEVLRHALHGQPHALAVGTTTLRGGAMMLLKVPLMVSNQEMLVYIG